MTWYFETAWIVFHAKMHCYFLLELFITWLGSSLLKFKPVCLLKSFWLCNKVYIHKTVQNGMHSSMSYHKVNTLNKCFKENVLALTGVARFVGLCAADWKVLGSITRQGTCLECGFCPQAGCMQEATNPCFFLTSMFLSLIFPSSPSLWSQKKKKF